MLWDCGLTVLMARLGARFSCEQEVLELEGVKAKRGHLAPLGLNALYKYGY